MAERKFKIAGRRVTVQENMLDRIVAGISPVRGAKRMQAKIAMALAGGRGGYDGASRTRKGVTAWNTTSTDADGDILPDIDLLRDRSRDLDRNNGVAHGALATKVTNIVGSGLKANPEVDAEALGISEDQAAEIGDKFEREFRLFAETPECDLARTLDFYHMTRMVAHQRYVNGDVFALLPSVSRAGSPFQTKVQLVEADRVSNPDFAADTPKVAGGVERDRYGAPSRVFISNRHPGSLLNTSTGMRSRRLGSDKLEWTPRNVFRSDGQRVVLHVFDPKRPGQSRGVPDLAPVIELFKQLGRYTEAEVMAAVVSGMFTVFVETENGEGLDTSLIGAQNSASGSGNAKNDESFELGYGAIVDLADGEKVSSANPGRPNSQFDPFVTSVLRQIGVALQLPFEILMKNFTASYSASRGAIIEAWKYFVTERSLYARMFCQPIYSAVILEAVAKGRVAAPGLIAGDALIRKAYLNCSWVGPGRGQINELVEAKAAVFRAQNNLSTIAKETAEMSGGDWQANHKQRKREVDMQRRDQILPPDMTDEGGAPEST